MKLGLLVISHGSKDAGWVTLVDETIETVRVRLGSAILVEAAFLELVEGRLIQDGLDRLVNEGVTHVFALPLFVSSGSTHVDEIGWALGAYPEPGTETELEKLRISGKLKLTYGQPMDDAPELITIVLDRLNEMSVDTSRESVLLVGHGSDEAGFREAWERGLDAIAFEVMKVGGYEACSTALLLPNQVQKKLELLKADYPDRQVLVMALFLSVGYFTKEVVPKRLESSGLAKECRYLGSALMPHPSVADWIVRQAREWSEGIGD
ncbi:cobalamin biosynthesis protein CbiX [Cohnella endophytica]|uniref:Cobalamin biosynthesis protein CbiX n=1 Tax=Cohnella endophytica TaxID=2419778 RepID=A0A494XKY0_9BACL|nr:CbiX/SirB N-terminal domain-containing protein [Cohnella endophytica]RKP48724.1 cobalamin biosynthesis protein CbiX [Cohnella endophytica]